MSLQHAAKHLEKHGRNGDTMLVHMSPKEVKSLSDLAMAGGGHLTINPHTGLPEAGFLKSLLPMIAGAGLTAVSGGLINPMTAGLLVGGGTGLITGDIKKGLVAGLGAYGGAGLASGLAASGTQAAAVNPSVTPPVSAAPVAPPVESVMTQPPPPIRPFANVGDPNLTQMFDPATMGAPTPPGLSGPAISPESIGFKPLTPAPNMVTTPAANAAYESSLANQQMAFDTGTAGERLSTMGKGAQTLTQPGGFSNFYENLANDPNTYGAKTTLAAAAAPTLAYAMEPEKPGAPPEITTDKTPASPLTYEYGMVNPAPAADVPKYGNLGQDFSQEQNYFQNAGYRPSTVQERGFAVGGPIEDMSNANSVGANTGYPMADISKGAYATPYQQPISRNMMTGATDTGVNPITGEMTNFAKGGISHLGDYSDGGRLLRGPGDGVSDSIPAVIGRKQPARLADGEFVVPARIVSELGNGSTEAGARKLYAMMDRIQKARKNTVGKGKVAKNSRSEKYLPA